MASKIVTAKFGGSSLADASQFRKVKDIVDQEISRRYIVASAPGKRHSEDHKVTDLLLMCYQLEEHNIDNDEVYRIISKRYQEIRKTLGLSLDLDSELEEIQFKISQGATRDWIASRGEYLNAKLLAEYLGFEFLDAEDIIIFDEAGRFDEQETYRLIQEKFNDSRYVIPGFYGRDSLGKVKTFSRGGSDVTGAIIAAGTSSTLYENWTDVSGFLKADPRIVEKPKSIEVVTYKELRELSYMGASVLHEEAIFPVRSRNIPIQILNTNSPNDSGTLIVAEKQTVGSGEITGIAGKKDFSVFSLEKNLMDEEQGFFRKLVSVFETNNVSISHMPSGIDSVSVIVPSEQVRYNSSKLLEEIRIFCRPDALHLESGIALIAVVGTGMIRASGIAARIFSALSSHDISIRMITQGASELSIILGVANSDFEQSIRAIYAAI